MLTQRIGYVVGYVLELTLDRQNLAQEGVSYIARTHPRDVAPGNTKAKAGSGRVSGRQQTSIQAERGKQFLRARDGGGHFRLPTGRVHRLNDGHSRGWRAARSSANSGLPALRVGVTGLPVVLAGVG